MSIEAQKIFERAENKFCIPVSRSEELRLCLESLADRVGLQREGHRFDINRTIYYFPGSINGFFPGFSIRYRDYSPRDFVDGQIADGTNGSFEIKCTDEDSSGAKKKIKIDSPFVESMTVEQLEDLIKSSSADEKTKEWFVDRLTNQGLKPGTLIEPLAAVTYKRLRYCKGRNVLSVDSSLNFYAVEPSNGIKFTKTGQYDGLVCEMKEAEDDINTRWQIYRTLVKHDAERFYSKKGQALNLLHYHLVKKLSPKPLNRELPEEEMELKVDLSRPFEATRILGILYDQFSGNNGSWRFRVAEDQPFYSSQSTLNQYFINKASPLIERKLLIRMGKYKYSDKKTLSPETDSIAHRTETKGVVYDNTRAAIRRDRGDFTSVGKVVRTRNSFWIYSESNRCYKVSVDINRKLPYSLAQLFCQLEAEYTGIIGQPENQEQARKIIRTELLVLKEAITEIFKENGIDFNSGGRKVDILRNWR